MARVSRERYATLKKLFRLSQTQQYHGMELQAKWENKHKVILEEQKQILTTKCYELQEEIVSTLGM